MAAELLEVDFISNSKAEEDLSLERNIKDISSIIKRHLIELFDLKIGGTDKLYRVCVGAYKDKSNAINQINLARGKGFGYAYIV